MNYISEQFEHTSKKQTKEHFKNLIKVAMADDIINNHELKILHRFGTNMGFTSPEINILIASTDKSEYHPPYELFKRFEQIFDILKMAYADGIIDNTELQLANKLALKFGFPEKEIPYLLKMLIEGIANGLDDEELFEIYKKKKNKLL